MEKKNFIKIDLLEKSSNLPKVRNYGIDLLKIIAMINVINLHINQHSYLLNLNPLDPKYKHVYCLEAFSIWPVNAFGLLSGIVGYKKYKFLNLIYIWFEYFFYSITIDFYSNFKSLKSPQIIFHSFFPLGKKRNWYVNAYFFMYLFLPFITTSINILDKIIFLKLVFFFLLVYSFYHSITTVLLKSNNYDYINEGYSSLWLLILYIIGAFIGRFYIRKYSVSSFYFFIIYLLSSFITSECLFLKWNIAFLKYYFPTIIIQAISLIMFFSLIKISHKFLIKVILFLNPLNFNVTLIHTLIIKKYYNFIKSLTPNFLFFKLYGISILIYSISVSIDYFRFIIFKLLKIRILCSLIEKKFININ